MKSICLSFLLCLAGYAIFAQSPSPKDAMMVVATPTDSTAKGR